MTTKSITLSGELVLYEKYLVKTRHYDYIGIYRGTHDNLNKLCNTINIPRDNQKKSENLHILFSQREIFYSINKIKYNAKKARESMEQRALDKILAKLINDNFKW